MKIIFNDNKHKNINKRNNQFNGPKFKKGKWFY